VAAVVAVLVLVAGVAVALGAGDGDGAEPGARELAGRRTGLGDGAAATTTTTAGARVAASAWTAAPTTTTAPTAPPTTAPPATAAPVAPAPRPPAATSTKKGASLWDVPGYGPAVADVGAGWYYNWSPRPADVGGAEFVPMIWGADSVNPDQLAQARANGTTLLGFNEPDFAEQADMTPERALDLWPQLEATGLRLGSPAPAVGGADPGGWLDRFLSGARQRGLRVDFVALHWYGGDFGPDAVNQLERYLQAVHDRYGLPVWLTEFALIRWGPGGAEFPTDAEQAAFVTASTAMLERLGFVERYAWFSLPTPDDGSQGTGLYRDPATPTAAGEAYRAAG
jgi:hypothetical protein